jgi:hypothetical protein
MVPSIVDPHGHHLEDSVVKLRGLPDNQPPLSARGYAHGYELSSSRTPWPRASVHNPFLWENLEPHFAHQQSNVKIFCPKMKILPVEVRRSDGFAPI